MFRVLKSELISVIISLLLLCLNLLTLFPSIFLFLRQLQRVSLICLDDRRDDSGRSRPIPLVPLLLPRLCPHHLLLRGHQIACRHLIVQHRLTDHLLSHHLLHADTCSLLTFHQFGLTFEKCLRVVLKDHWRVILHELMLLLRLVVRVLLLSHCVNSLPSSALVPIAQLLLVIHHYGVG